MPWKELALFWSTQAHKTGRVTLIRGRNDKMETNRTFSISSKFYDTTTYVHTWTERSSTYCTTTPVPGTYVQTRTLYRKVYTIGTYVRCNL